MGLQQELSRLWNANLELSRLYEVIENELEGETNDYIDNKLQFDRENVEEGCNNLLELRQLLEGQYNFAAKEIERLNKIVEQREREINRIEEIIRYTLIKFGEKDKKGVFKMNLNKYILSTRRSQVTEIDDIEKIPSQYVKWKGDFNFDADTYKKAKEILIREMAINIEGKPVPDKTEIKKAILADAENDEDKAKDKEILNSDKIEGAFVRNKISLVIK